MTDLPAILRRMAEMGLTMEQAAEIAELFEPRRTPGAERQARYRARKAGDVTSDATGDVTALPPSLPPTPPNPSSIHRPPSPPKGGSSPKGEARPQRRARARTRVPEDWSPRPEDLAMAEAEGLTAGEIERELARMRDCHFRYGRTDWDAAFRNWIRKAIDLRPRHDPRPDHPASGKLAARQANFERAIGGFATVAGRLSER